MGTRYVVKVSDIKAAGIAVKEEWNPAEDWYDENDDCWRTREGYHFISCCIGGWEFSSFNSQSFAPKNLIGPNLGKQEVVDELKEKGIPWDYC